MEDQTSLASTGTIQRIEKDTLEGIKEGDDQMTKSEAIEYLEKIEEDEPVFILRGQDKVAPEAISLWVCKAGMMNAKPEKLKGAMDVRVQMLDWQAQNLCKVPD